MKRFQFSLESLLKQKSWIEEEAQRILGQETAKLQDLVDKRELILNEKNELIFNKRSLHGLGAEQHQHFVRYQQKLSDDLIETQTYIIQQEKVVEEKNGLLINAVKERKKIEKLKEREYENYKLAQKRKETTLMDEVSSNFHDRNQ